MQFGGLVDLCTIRCRGDEEARTENGLVHGGAVHASMKGETGLGYNRVNEICFKWLLIGVSY